MATKSKNLTVLRIIFLIFLVLAISTDTVILLTNCIFHIFFNTFTLNMMSVDGNFSRTLLAFITSFSLVFYIIFFLINYVLVIIFSAIFSRNCKYINNGSIQFSFGWTIGNFFIPIISYFRPYQALKEFYTISQSEQTNHSPFHKYILFWWLSFLANSIAIRFIGDFENIPLLPVDIIILGAAVDKERNYS